VSYVVPPWRRRRQRAKQYWHYTPPPTGGPVIKLKASSSWAAATENTHQSVCPADFLQDVGLYKAPQTAAVVLAKLTKTTREQLQTDNSLSVKYRQLLLAATVID